METNLLTAAESIGKYFGFRFIFTNNEVDENGKYKAKILQSKTIVINDLQIDYEENINNDDSNFNLWIIIGPSLLGVLIVCLIVWYYSKKNKNARTLLDEDNDCIANKSGIIENEKLNKAGGY